MLALQGKFASGDLHAPHQRKLQTHTLKKTKTKPTKNPNQKTHWCASLLATLCETIFFLTMTELCTQSPNTTNCESVINNQMTVTDDGKSVSKGIIGKNNTNSFPLNILNSLFRG